MKCKNNKAVTLGWKEGMIYDNKIFEMVFEY